jgi:transposase InsO family protein
LSEMSWQGHGSHVPRLPAVPEGENPQAAYSSSPRHPCARTQVFPRAREPVGPLPASFDGHMYLLTIIDRSTRWMEAVPLPNMEASTCTDALIANWVAHFGMPATVTTDKGAQFTSALWSAACMSLGIKHVLTTAYHPQNNRMVEYVHRCPTCLLSRPGMGFPSSLGADGPACSAERGFGCLISRAGHWDTTHTSWPAATRTRSSMCRRAAATHAASILCRSHQHTARSPSPGGHIYVPVGGQQKPLAAPYASPYLVVSKGAKTFTI